jgi:hypothetical protein
MSEETKNKISKTLKEKYEKNPHPNLGKKRTDEFKLKCSLRTKGEKNPNYGRRYKEEELEKMRIAGKRKVGDKNPFYGKKHSEESILNNKITQLKKGIGAKNKSGFKGVSWDKRRNKWRVVVNRKYAGHFEDKLEAVKKYDEVAKEMFGENIITNKELGVFNLWQ